MLWCFCSPSWEPQGGFDISACCYLIMKNHKPQQTFLGFAVCCCRAAVGLPILSTSWGFRERSRFLNLNFGALLPQGTADLVMPFSFFIAYGFMDFEHIVYSATISVFYAGLFFKEPARINFTTQMYSRHIGLRIYCKKSRGRGIFMPLGSVHCRTSIWPRQSQTCFGWAVLQTSWGVLNRCFLKSA